MDDAPRDRLRRAIEVDDRDAIAALLGSHPDLASRLDEPLLAWRQPALAGARSVETADLLLERGAGLEAVGAWWAPGFGVIDGVDAEVGRLLADRGAPLTAHAAAALGLHDRLALMLDDDPDLVHARGGDGATPLHFARDVETADLLLDRGARPDARDDDHDSTPAQWLIGSCSDVARRLLERGATPDLFLAAALDDRALVDGLIAADPGCVSLRIGKEPMHGIGHRGLGGTILQWTLAFNSYAHQIAAARGHDALFERLVEASDPTTRLLVACVMGRRAEAERIAATHPGLVASLDEADLELPALYCWETNASLDAVELMLDLGFPVDRPERRHGYTPLHNAAWGGFADLVDLLIARGHPVDGRDPEHCTTPLEWAIHCCLRDGRHPEGDYERVVAALIDAGSPWDPAIYPTGDPRIDAALGPRR